MLPNPYVLLAAGGLWIASLVGASLWYGHHVAQGYELRLAQESAAGQKLLTQETARRLSAEQKQAEANNAIEETNAKAQRDIEAAHSDFNARVARSVRPYRECPRDSATGGKAIDNGGGADNAVVGLFVPQQAINDLGDLATAADQWAAYGRACHAWALEVGR